MVIAVAGTAFKLIRKSETPTHRSYLGGTRCIRRYVSSTGVEPEVAEMMAFLQPWQKQNGFGNETFVDTISTTKVDASESTYGEILPTSLNQLLKGTTGGPPIKIAADNVMYDLGSGVGKVVAQFAFDTPCKKALGVEMGIRRHQEAEMALSSCTNELVASKIEYLNANILDVAWEKDATILFVNAFCFPQHVMDNIEQKLLKMPKGQMKYVLLFGDRLGAHTLALRPPGTFTPEEIESRITWSRLHTFFRVPVKMSFDDSFCELYCLTSEVSSDAGLATRLDNLEFQM